MQIAISHSTGTGKLNKTIDGNVNPEVGMVEKRMTTGTQTAAVLTDSTKTKRGQRFTTLRPISVTMTTGMTTKQMPQRIILLKNLIKWY